jgi:hypothetical protein
MARININEFSAQAGGLAFRANQVRTDPAVVKAAQDAWVDVKDARNSCAILVREASAAWQRTRSEADPTAHQAYPTPSHLQDRPTAVAS